MTNLLGAAMRRSRRREVDISDSFGEAAGWVDRTVQVENVNQPGLRQGLDEYRG